MIAMISQPMAGKARQEIVETRESAIRALRENGYKIIDNLFAQWQDGFPNRIPFIFAAAGKKRVDAALSMKRPAYTD